MSDSLPAPVNAMSSTVRVYGGIAMSVVVIVGFVTVVIMAMLRPIPPGSETLVNVLFGTLGTMAAGVVNYWVGSSAGSAAKDKQTQ